MIREDGTIERKAFARYFICLINRPNEEALVDEEHIVRDRKSFTKQRLRSFIKNTVTREAWTGAPWLVKAQTANKYRITTDIPHHLRRENQLMQRRANTSLKKADLDRTAVSLFPIQGPLPEVKSKGNKSKNGNQDQARQRQEHFFEYQRALTGNPAFAKITHPTRPNHFTQYSGENLVFPVGHGFPPIAAKAPPKPSPPPPPKYPIEDLEIRPARDGNYRPPMRYLSQDTPGINQGSDGAGSGILMESVGLLLETWNSLNVWCQVYELDSFTFDDYIEALQFSSDEVQCELIVEIHCAVLKKLVNDVDDKNGQVQVSLPELVKPESDKESGQDTSSVPTPTPEPEIKPVGRTTRSSFAKSEAAELKALEEASRASPVDSRLHRAAEVDQSGGTYDWKSRLRKRDFGDGKWIVIIVGLLNQLTGFPRLKKTCDEILIHLAPLGQDPIPATVISQYATLNINLRVKVIQILCILSVETKAVRAYMEDCNNEMTVYRKEKIELQRARKAA